MIMDWDTFLEPYEQAVKELTALFVGFKKADELSPILYVEGRVKRVYSLLYKLNRKQFSITGIEEKIDDIAGIRLVCNFVANTEQVIQLIRSRNNIDFQIKEEQDYILHPKESGYSSYHLVVRYPVQTATGLRYVKAEIQIRSMVMDFWSKLEHSLQYKQGPGAVDESIKAKFLQAAKQAMLLDAELGDVYHQALSGASADHKADLIEIVQKNIFRLSQINPELAEEYNQGFLENYPYMTAETLAEFNTKLEGEQA